MDPKVKWTPPPFWWAPGQRGWRILLAPFAFLFIFGGWIRKKTARPQKAPFPVLSIGNLVMGGAGKTPTVLAIAHYLQKKNAYPIIVLRGYGGRIKRPTLVDPLIHTVRDVGDEALLMAEHYPTYIARRRKDVLPLLHHAPASSIILLDDGHQHHSLVKDLSLLVIDGRQQFGNRAVFPSGPLRESLQTGLKRADGLIVIGETENTFLEDWPDEVLLRASLKPLTALPEDTRVVGFSGIGYPQKFLKTLEEMGLQVKGFACFPDHYVYQEKDLLFLHEKARAAQAILVTTKKDFLRIPLLHRDAIKMIEIELVFHHFPLLEDLLKGLWS